MEFHTKYKAEKDVVYLIYLVVEDPLRGIIYSRGRATLRSANSSSDRD